jgi:enoyl-[acyl-carrier-protein] reductase (NADH)
MTKIAKTKTKTDTIIAPSFVAAGARITVAFQKFDKASQDLEDGLQNAFQKFIDQCTVAGMPRTKESCDAIKKAIATACDEGTGMLATAIATGGLERKTIIEYGSGAQRAFFHGIKWYSSLKNETAENLTLPWGKTKKATKAGVNIETTKAGAVSTTTVEELAKTLSKAIEQARLLQMRDFANELGGFVASYLDSFKFTSKSE